MPFASIVLVLRGTLLSLLFSVLLTGCGPSRYLSVSPVGWGTHPVSNLVSHPDSVYVRFHFVRAEAKELVFEAEFSNAANHPITIDPAGFYFLPLPDSTAKNTTSRASIAGRHLASNPEMQLYSLALRRDQQAAKAENVSWLEIFTIVVNTAENVASVGKKETAHQEAARDISHENDRIYFDNERADHADKARELHSQVTTMASSLLRGVTLQPGDRAVGLVHFPRLDAARQLRFVLAFDEQPVSFDFTQEVRKLNGK